MKRSSSNSAVHGANKSRKQDNAGHQWKILQFKDNRVLVVVDNGGVIWFGWVDVIQALDIRTVPSDVYDYCERKKYIRQLSDLSVSDSSITVPGTTLLIVAEGVRQIESHSGRPRDRQFIESIFDLLNTLTFVTNHQTEASANRADEPVSNPYAEEVERLKRENARQKEELAKRDAERQQEKAKLEEEKRLVDKKLEKCKNVIRNLKSREPTQIVYIATCRRYALENKFKVGGVRSMELLKGRLAVSNTGRTPEDVLYYCFWVKCSNHRRLEQRVADVIGEHRVRQEAEMYHLHYLALKEVVEYLSERFNEEEEKYKGMFDSLIRDTLEKEPVVPSPWILNGAEYRQMKQAGEECADVGIEQLYNFDSMEEEDQYCLVANSLDEYIKSLLPSLVDANVESDKLILTRRNCENYMSRSGVKFAKRSFWKVLKVVAESRKVSVKY